MGKDNNDENLEYYQAKQGSGQVPAAKKETRKLSSSDDSKLRAKSDGYLPMNDSQAKQREFERYKEITFAQKASEKAKKNPLIPIGLLTTVAALTLGLRAVSRGDKWQSQMMMRARIGYVLLYLFFLLFFYYKKSNDSYWKLRATVLL
ncbi:unnamed protein product [Rotaria magnacalcarata]